MGEVFNQSAKRLNAFKGIENYEKAVRPVYNLCLQQFLDGTASGKYVLATYSREKSLNRKSRGILVDLLINGAMATQDG